MYTCFKMWNLSTFYLYPVNKDQSIMAPVLSIHKNMSHKYFNASLPHMISYAGLKMC